MKPNLKQAVVLGILGVAVGFSLAYVLANTTKYDPDWNSKCKAIVGGMAFAGALIGALVPHSESSQQYRKAATRSVLLIACAACGAVIPAIMSTAPGWESSAKSYGLIGVALGLLAGWMIPSEWEIEEPTTSPPVLTVEAIREAQEREKVADEKPRVSPEEAAKSSIGCCLAIPSILVCVIVTLMAWSYLTSDHRYKVTAIEHVNSHTYRDVLRLEFEDSVSDTEAIEAAKKAASDWKASHGHLGAVGTFLTRKGNPKLIFMAVDYAPGGDWSKASSSEPLSSWSHAVRPLHTELP